MLKHKLLVWPITSMSSKHKLLVWSITFNGRFQYEFLSTYQGPGSVLRTQLPQLTQSAKLAFCRLVLKIPFQVQKLKTQRG